MRKIPGKHVKAIVVGILGFLVIVALVVVSVSEGRKLYGETNVSALPTPTNEGQEFFQFVLLILGAIFVICMTGFVSVLVQRMNECNLKDAILISGLASSIPCLFITIVTVAMGVYELLFMRPGVNVTTVIFTVTGILESLATFAALVLLSIIFGVFAWVVRKTVKKAV
jgi:hypothetical protein